MRKRLNPPGSPAGVHQYLNIGEGELDWDVFFKKLNEVGFDGIMTACVFAWEDRAIKSSRIRERIGNYAKRYWEQG